MDRNAAVPFDDLVDDDGTVDLDHLVATVGESDVEVGAVADEDLAWFSRVPDARPDPRFDAPRLGALDEDGYRVAMDSAFAVLAARGELVVDDDGEVDTAGPRGFVVGLQDLATRRMRVEATGPAGPRRLVLHRLPEDVVLVRRVGLGGIHHAWLARPATAAAAVAGLVDPDARADTTAEVQRAAGPEQLDPPPRRLHADAEVAALIGVEGMARGLPSGEGRRLLATYALADRLVLVRGPAEGAAGAHTAQAVSPRDLLTALRDALQDES